MKVRIALVVGDFERYVIAKYYAETDAPRRRASRVQVRKFVAAALESVARDLAADLRGRSRSAAKRLADGRTETPDRVAPPIDRQPDLF